MANNSKNDLPEHRRTIRVFVLAMFSLAVVVSLRNLPLSAEYGFSSIFFYIAAAILFMIPYSLVAAELASGWPKAGGVFIWVKEALGTRWGFFAIWMQWFHNITFYPAMLAFIGAALAQFISPELGQNKAYLLSIILIGFWSITLFNFLGIKTSSLLTTVFVIIGVIIPGALLIGFAASWFATETIVIPVKAKDIIPDLSHWTNLVFLGGIFLALSGVEVNANLAREVVNPQKNYPRAIFTAAALTILISILGSLAIAIVIPKQELSLVTGLLDTFRFYFQQYQVSWLIPIIALCIVLGALGELNAWAIAGIKGLFVTTEYGCLPALFHKINQKHVPVSLLFFQAILVSIAAFVFLYLPNVETSFWVLSALSAQLYLLTYILLFISVIVLRYTRSEVKRTYEIPFNKLGVWVVASIGLLASLFAFIISFFPPLTTFDVGNLFVYEAVIVIGFVISCAIPLAIYAFRKPHWQLEILEEIREEIHQSMHH